MCSEEEGRVAHVHSACWRGGKFSLQVIQISLKIIFQISLKISLSIVFQGSLQATQVSRHLLRHALLSRHGSRPLVRRPLSLSALRRGQTLLQRRRRVGARRGSVSHLPAAQLPALHARGEGGRVCAVPLRQRVSPRQPAQRDQVLRPVLLGGRRHRLSALSRRDARHQEERELRVQGV